MYNNNRNANKLNNNTYYQHDGADDDDNADITAVPPISNDCSLYLFLLLSFTKQLNVCFYKPRVTFYK